MFSFVREAIKTSNYALIPTAAVFDMVTFPLQFTYLATTLPLRLTYNITTLPFQVLNAARNAAIDTSNLAIIAASEDNGIQHLSVANQTESAQRIDALPGHAKPTNDFKIVLGTELWGSKIISVIDNNGNQKKYACVSSENGIEHYEEYFFTEEDNALSHPVEKGHVDEKQSDSVLKICKLLTICKNYQRTRFDDSTIKAASKIKDHDIIKDLGISKCYQVNRAIKILESKNNPQQKLSQLRAIYPEMRDVLEMHRDNATIRFLKYFLHTITLGLARYMGIWNVKGEKMARDMEAVDSSLSLSL